MVCKSHTPTAYWQDSCEQVQQGNNEELYAVPTTADKEWWEFCNASTYFILNIYFSSQLLGKFGSLQPVKLSYRVRTLLNLYHPSGALWCTFMTVTLQSVMASFRDSQSAAHQPSQPDTVLSFINLFLLGAHICAGGWTGQNIPSLGVGWGFNFTPRFLYLFM